MLRIRGARQNNLSDVDVDIPLHKLVVFCGRSGSGKSSLAFDTLLREGQRRYLAALLMRGANLQRPDVLSITNLPPTIGLDQRPRGFAGSETVATISELGLSLAVLFARAGVQHCPSCGAAIRPYSHDEIVSELLALPAGTRLLIEAPVTNAAGVYDEIVRAGFSRVRVNGQVVRLEEVTELPDVFTIVVDRLKVSPERRARMMDAIRLASRAGQGVVYGVHQTTTVFVDRPVCVVDGVELAPLHPARMRILAAPVDDTIAGVQLGDARYGDVAGCRVDVLLPLLSDVPKGPVATEVMEDIRHRVAVLVDLGLGALRVGQPVTKISRSELARLRLARQASSQVSGVLYVLDEPAAGLDPESARRVVRLLRRLVSTGNSVLAVGHHPQLIEVADHLVEFGPGSGPQGGEIVYSGPLEQLKDTATAAVRAGSIRPLVPPAVRGTILVAGAELASPGVTVITGLSGTGKTRRLGEIAAAARFERVIEAKVGKMGRTSRSNPATYTKLWSVLRDLLRQTKTASILGLTASAFSLNTPGGRCEACRGAGEVRTVLDPLPDVWEVCGVCKGRRFQSDVLEVRWRGLAPDQLLKLTVDEAHTLLAGHPKLERILRALKEVSLGHVPLGRGTDTLSGGELRRLQLARELARTQGVALVLADDPSLGLHPADTVELMSAFHHLAARGATVVLASSDPFVVESSQRRILVESPL